MTGAPICQLCQMAVLSASRRWTIRAYSPAGTRPPWRSRPSWFLSVQMIASTRWRSQFGKGRGVFSSLRAGRIRFRPRPGGGEERLGVLAGQALVCDDCGTGRWPVSGLVLQHDAGGLPFADQLGVGQRESGYRPVAGDDEQQLAAPVPARVARTVAVPRVPVQVRTAGGDDRLAACDRRGVHQPQQLRAARCRLRQPPQRRLHQRRRGLDALVVLALPQEPQEQVSDLLGRGAQPAPLVVMAQQHLRDGQADQLRVGHLRPLPRP